ncbi:MAG: DUF1232 domain-containing protein [Paludibacteraceae bacterium]|nr:DUF1232 domain-containing protein [Paludibacteraceae bacterium]
MSKSTKYKWNIWIGAIAALIYVIIPFDISPDAVPVLGWIDDIVAILLAIANGIIFGRKLRHMK